MGNFANDVAAGAAEPATTLPGAAAAKPFAGFFGTLRARFRPASVKADARSETNMGLDAEKGKPKPKTEMDDVKPVNYLRLYATSKPFDYFLIVLGTVGAIGAGLSLPILTILFGSLINAFNPSSTNMSSEELTSEINKICLQFIYVAIGTAIASYLEVAAWMLLSVRLTNRLRERYLQSALRQEVAFYDTAATTGVLLQGLNEDANAVQTATGEKVGMVVHHLATFVGGLTVGFIRGWRLALVMVAVLPLIGVIGAAFGAVVGALSTKAADAYGHANSLVQQALSNIKTVMSFNGQDTLIRKYREAIRAPQYVATKQGILSGATLGSVMGIMYCAYALALWYGGKRVVAGDMNGGQVLTVLFSVLLGGLSLGQAAPILQHFVAGRTAGARVWKVIDRQTGIADAKDAEVPAALIGNISLRRLRFAYPSRPDVNIFTDLSLDIPAGRTIALVGESGSGKSSVVSMIMRFYDPLQGQVLLDGVDLRNLPIGWLRKQVGLVSQEPCLFATTIYNNILYGAPEATSDQIYAAAKAANCHSFITNLPNGYDTKTGELGGQLSGGQKQRIAIARAVLKNPGILLLDEATSALDSTSERVVQKALDKLMGGNITTIVIAHRLSTIKNVDIIAVMKRGEVVETGSHRELLAREGGAYATLVQLQQQRSEQEEVPDIEDERAEEFGDTRRLSDVGGSKRHLSTHSLVSKGSNQPIEEIEVSISWWRRCFPSKPERKPVADAEVAQTKVSFFRLLKLNKPEAPIAVVGCIASGLLGIQMPAFSFALASIIAAYYLPVAEIPSQAAKWALAFVAIGVGTFIVSLLQTGCFAHMGAKLARRVRMLSLTALLRQEMAWFDEEGHSSGAVSARLATDASAVRGAVGDQLGLIFQNIVTVITGLTIAFIYGWKLTLVTLAVLPLMGAAGYAQAVFMTGFSGQADKLFAAANETAAEAFSNIRTIAAFQMEHSVGMLYSRLLQAPTQTSSRRAQASGLGFGFSQGSMFITYSLAFWFGGKQVANGEMSFEDVFKVFFAVLFMATGVSQSQMAFPDVSKAKAAVANIFALVDTKPKTIDIDAPGVELAHVSGSLELRDITFAYPARPSVAVFRQFTLAVAAGSSVALVGPSGSGKSTVIALLQRFYDPQAGEVLLDGVNIATLQLKWLRQHIGVVSQEPVLFNTTIGENIRYGRQDATFEEIRSAALQANAGFVETLPEGFNTEVGQAGIQLSGGQKQRIAIARALIKMPRVLLLDEATSALDVASEAAVQEALDSAAQGRTTIIVAHRLSTIRNANTIAVVQDGAILESGTHTDLILKPGGAYAALVKNQQGK